MNLKRFKKEFFYLRKAFVKYKIGWRYAYGKYLLAGKIYGQRVIERPVNNKDLSIHVLAGSGDLTMLLWSLRSFYRQMSEIGQLYVHNDGTFTRKNFDLIKKHLPSAKIIQPNDVLERLSDHKIIRKFRTRFPEYFLLKKIVDTFFISEAKMHLIIDSDLYWYRQPTEIERGIKNGAPDSLVMENSAPCYVYFKEGKAAEEKALVNSGIVLYNKSNFNLQKFSSYLEKIDTDNKKNWHFIEQAGFAYSLENLKVLPRTRYVIKGNLSSETVARHYTSPRRPLFYSEAIPFAIKSFSE